MQRPIQLLLILLTIILYACQSTPKGEIADIIYHNGHIITMEDEAEKATSIAVKNGKILAMARSAEFQRLADPLVHEFISVPDSMAASS